MATNFNQYLTQSASLHNEIEQEMSVYGCLDSTTTKILTIDLVQKYVGWVMLLLECTSCNTLTYETNVFLSTFQGSLYVSDK